MFLKERNIILILRDGNEYSLVQNIPICVQRIQKYEIEKSLSTIFVLRALYLTKY